MGMGTIYGHGYYIWAWVLFMGMGTIYGHGYYTWAWVLYMGMGTIYGSFIIVVNLCCVEGFIEDRCTSNKRSR